MAARAAPRRHVLREVGPVHPGVGEDRAASARRRDLSALRAGVSIRSPLSEDGFRWIGDAVGEQMQVDRGGVRMGTADFSAVVEASDEVSDSLVIDTSELTAPAEGALLCFVLAAGGS